MSKSRFVSAGTPPTGTSRVLILGEPGAGKTRLAGTFPDTLFFDLEDGAGTARPGGVNRLVIPPDTHALSTVRTKLQSLAKLKQTDHCLEFPSPGGPVQVRTLVIDSLDAVQQPVKLFDILKGRRKMERDDWDVLLNLMAPLVLEWQQLPIHVVVTTHSKRVEGEKGRPGIVGLSVQGSLRVQVPRWFDLILHIWAGPDGKRVVITQPMIRKGYRYTAKDRHNQLASLLKSGVILLPADKEGYPSDEIAKAICG